MSGSPRVSPVADRAVSTALGYVLGLAIITALITGLFFATSEIVSEERERAAESELRVLGNRLAADITTVDRLALSSNDSRARLTRELPNSVAGSSYRIRLEHDGSRPATIELTASELDVSVSVPVMNGTAVANSTSGGGGLVVGYDGQNIELGEDEPDVLIPDELVRMNDRTAGATDVEMEINFQIEAGSPTIGNSLNSMEIDVQSGSPDMFSGTSQSDVVEMGVDTDGDGRIDNDIESDINGWDVSNNGSTLRVELGGSEYTNPQAGDTVILTIDNVDNPTSPGTYDVRIQTSDDGNWQDGSITIT